MTNFTYIVVFHLATNWFTVKKEVPVAPDANGVFNSTVLLKQQAIVTLQTWAVFEWPVDSGRQVGAKVEEITLPNTLERTVPENFPMGGPVDEFPYRFQRLTNRQEFTPIRIPPLPPMPRPR